MTTRNMLSDETVATEAEELPPKKTSLAKLWRTVLVALAWLCMGLYSEVSGPTLPYLRYRVDSNWEEISRSLMARSVGFLLGSLAGGVLCERYCKHVDLWLALSLGLAALGTAVAPWCTHLALLATMFALDGAGKGILAAGGNGFVITLWGEEASAPCHSLHFAFGIGALIVPQIARPFLTEPPSGSDKSSAEAAHANQSDTTASYAVAIDNATIGNEAYEATIEWPYSIVAAITLLCGLAFALTYCFVPLKGRFIHGKKPPTLRKMLDPSSCVPGSKIFAIQFLVLLSVLFALPVGAERAYGKFIFAYAVEGPVSFSPGDGTTLETVFWSAFTAGRGLSTVLAKWVPALYLLLVEIGISLASSSLLVALGGGQPIALYVCTGLFAISLSPIFPTVLSWANLRIVLTPMLTSMAFIASAGGAFVFSWLGGYLFEVIGPPSLMHMMLGYSIILACVFALAFFLVRTSSVPTVVEDVVDAKDLNSPEMEALKCNTAERTL